MIAHDLARFCGHNFFVLPAIERKFRRRTDVLRMREKNRPLADCKIRCRLQAVLSRPGIYHLEKDFVGSEHVAVDEMFGLHEELKRCIDAGHKRGVSKPPDNIDVLFVGEIAHVALRFKIAEWIEDHGLDSRR